MDNMQLWLSSSTDSINLNDSAEGFYLNPDLDGLTGLPEIRSVNGLNAGYDGGWTATQLWAARLITIRGVIATNDKAAVETKRKALAKLLSQGKNEDLELKFVSEAGNTYTATVRTTNCTMALQRVFWRQEYQIQLRANDPLIYDDGGSELVAILRVMSGEGGFEIPFDIPFDIGGTVTPTSVDVGDEATYPLIRLKGDLHNPTIISLTTNQRMQVLADIITTIEWHDYTTAYTTNGYTQINSTEDGAPLSLTHLYGNATQKTLSGKNLIKVRPTSASANGITWTLNPDGSVKVSGTATANQTISFGSVNMEQGKTYTLSGCPSGGASGKYMFYTNVVDPQFQDYGSGSTHTVSADATAQIYFIVYGGKSVDGTIYPQLEIGNQATDYQEYCGGIPSPNPDFPQDINVLTGNSMVKIMGKNLFADTSDGFYKPVDYYIRPIQLEQGKTYQFYQALKTGATIIPNIVVGIVPYGEKYADFSGVMRNIINYNGTTTERTFAPDATWTSPKLIIYAPTLAKIDEIMASYDIMLEQSATKTTYEPYQGQSQEINLGKNLFDTDTAVTRFETYNGNAINDWGTYSDGIVTIVKSNGAHGTCVFAGFKPALIEGQTYTLSADVYLSGTNASTELRFGTQPNSPKVAISDKDTWIRHTKTFTATASDVADSRIDIQAWNTGNIIQIKNIQLEAGAQATAYAPYKTPIELAKIGTYQDYIWNDNGTWKIHKATKKLVLDGTENWALGSMFYCTDAVSGKTAVSPATGGAIMSDYFTYSGGATADPSIDIVNGNILRIKDTSKADVATFKTWLGTHNTTVYYALATPTDTEITDSELIAQLNHIYELYQGTNNAMLIPNAGAQGEMTVTYATTVDRDYHEVVIDCQARTVTQDGRNLYPALADGSEFIRLLPGENRLYLTSEVESDNGTAEVKFKKGNISI